MLSYARWVIILVYFIVDESEDIEKHQILVGLLIEDKMFKMWIGESYSETNVMKDFISIK